MSQFYSFSAIFDVSYLLEVPKLGMDILSRLPPEIACRILRMLDPTSLIACMGVAEGWRELCRSDPLLRRRIRSYLRADRERRTFKENFAFRPKGLKRIAKYLGCVSRQKAERDNDVQLIASKRSNTTELNKNCTII